MTTIRELLDLCVSVAVPGGCRCGLCGGHLAHRAGARGTTWAGLWRRLPAPLPAPLAAVCAACRSRLPLLAPPLCETCGKPIRCASHRSGICHDCSIHPRHFLLARAVGLYEGSLRSLLHELKYCSRESLARPLGELLAELALPQVISGLSAGRTAASRPIIVPVPLHRDRLLTRGFNQAEALARVAARALGLELATGYVERVAAPSGPQSTLSGTARRSSLRGAFVVTCPSALRGRDVIVVDDVITTGTTVDEVSRAVLRAGALRVGAGLVAVGVTRADWLQARPPSASPAR